MAQKIINRKIKIDKTILHNFFIESIDLNLPETQNYKCRITSDSSIKTKNNICIDRLIITDKYFGKLICDGSGDKAFTSLEMSVSETNNLYGLSVLNYKKRIKEVFDFIYSNYHVKIKYSTKKLRLSQIELNTTFKLKDSFSSYRPIWEIIINNLPKGKYTRIGNNQSNKVYEWNEITKHNNGITKTIETIGAKNSRTELIIYNKTKSLYDKGITNIPDKMVRVEYKFKAKDSGITSFLGTSISKLTNEKTYKLFMSRCHKDICKPSEAFLETNAKEIERIIMSLNTNNTMSKNWLEQLVQNIEQELKNGTSTVILNDKDILEALKKMNKKNKGRTLSRIKSKLEYKSYYVNDLQDRANEILKCIS